MCSCRSIGPSFRPPPRECFSSRGGDGYSGYRAMPHFLEHSSVAQGQFPRRICAAAVRRRKSDSRWRGGMRMRWIAAWLRGDSAAAWARDGGRPIKKKRAAQKAARVAKPAVVNRRFSFPRFRSGARARRPPACRRPRAASPSSARAA
ncbi:hypothetical protein CO709_09430 [Burkholderia thailandensis]|nr:hypothetical protein CO709_09430 [Burkholderia thailandensis]